jgi:hypothetical protein
MENREVYHIEPGVKEIVITHKKGLDEKAPINIDVCGNIDSVTNFLNVRHAAMYKDEHVINDHDSLVLTKKEDRKIVLLYNSTHPFNHGTITGQLSLHPNFEKWGINTGQGWNNDELAEFIKMNRSYFKSKSDAMKLSGELKNLKVNVDKKIEASNDNRGNVKALTAQTVIDSSILKTFMINVPVFKGQPKKEFEVEVYVNPNNFQVTLVSPDANDIIEEVRDSIIDEQIEKIKRVAPGIPIIEQ